MARLRRITYRLESETWESQRAAGRYNPATELVYRLQDYPEQRVTLSSGAADDLTVRRESDLVHVLTVNRGLGYIGLQSFDGLGKAILDVFLQADHEIESLLGPRVWELCETTLIRRLSNLF